MGPPIAENIFVFVGFASLRDVTKVDLIRIQTDGVAAPPSGIRGDRRIARSIVVVVGHWHELPARHGTWIWDFGKRINIDREHHAILREPGHV